ncbi:GTP cyclohydrolase 1 type 2 [Philodulcilactobacillus myokoensis]|uniref:GTP cyclohydrolase 1 type 2 homolog n=1 Tax=Philodulcilactobacillus myokoensis TaxID=2929573 RepID=A0A9W6B134_9LACO|nr:Nif3-like dinuclear metal center hexameric protein [Philodulcilactobacillus myokoensis]GLB46902.1 GTP cyclohydrolase 1 type 2 [Philodulcilactobacillus myokoensis]
MKVRTIVDQFEKLAPKQLAESWDPIGLQIGSLNANVNKMMITLDVRPEVVDEAIKRHVDFIFAHHPVMFHPAKNLDLSNPQNQMYANIIKHHITVYAAHTNLDSANHGMNDWLAQQVGLNHVSGLVPNHFDPDHYSMGRVGELKKSISVMDFAKKCKKIFNINGLRLISHHPDQVIKKVAILGGSGSEFYPQVLKKHADVYITGDVTYHTAHDMIASGLSVIDPGHHIECICIPKLAELFQKWNQEFNWNIEIVKTEINTEPFTFI